MVFQEQVIDSVFPETTFNQLVSVCKRQYKRFPFTEEFGRYFINDKEWTALQIYTSPLLGLARKVFGSSTLEHSYSIFAHYEGNLAALPKHKDNNACTYTLDVCLYQETPWSLWIEGEEYYLEPNQGIAFYGEDQEHWREDFPNPVNNQVGQLFVHFVEPEHWYFSEQNA